MRIAIAIATRGNDIYAKLLHFCCEAVKKYNCDIVTSEAGFSAEQAQTNLFHYILSCDFDYVLLIDSDVAVPFDTLDKLLACKTDIVSAPVLHYDPMTNDIHWNISLEMINPTEFKRLYERKDSGVEELMSSSFACLLLSKKVFQIFKDAGESFFTWSPLVDERWNRRNSDNIFFLKAKALGLRSFVCWEIKGAVHNRTIKLTDQLITHFYAHCPQKCKSEIIEIKKP
ncbi:MAG: hypothetical protein WCI77_07920 [Candidatus Omnitrophota bacterium]